MTQNETTAQPDSDLERVLFFLSVVDILPLKIAHKTSTNSDFDIYILLCVYSYKVCVHVGLFIGMMSGFTLCFTVSFTCPRGLHMGINLYLNMVWSIFSLFFSLFVSPSRTQVQFVAVNCWWSQGKCRKQNRFYQYPIIHLFYRRWDRGERLLFVMNNAHPLNITCV